MDGGTLPHAKSRKCAGCCKIPSTGRILRDTSARIKLHSGVSGKGGMWYPIGTITGLLEALFKTMSGIF